MANIYEQFLDEGDAPRSTMSPRDRELAIRTVLGEAADQPDEGQAAVAAVIRNRMQAGRYGGENIPGVVLARHQFEPWSTQAGRNRMYGYAPDSEPYQRAAAAVDRVFGEGYDPTGGSTHFFSPTAQAALGRQPPRWAQGQPLTIGGHAFYAPEGRVGAAPGAQPVAYAPETVQAGPFSSAASAERPVPQTPQMAQAGGNVYEQFVTPTPTLPAAGENPYGQFAPSGTERIDPAAPRSPLRIEVTPEQPKPAEGAGSSQGDVGRFTALLRGASSGATFNFADELAGILNSPDYMAGRQGEMAGPLQAIGGLAKLGYETLTGSPGEATKAYEQARDAARQELKTAKEQYPGTTLAGELAGAVAVPLPGVAALRGAGMATRAAGSAGIGFGVGGLSGAGEGETGAERLSKAATGAAVGGVVGWVASPVLDVATRAGGRALTEAGRYLFPNTDARALKILQGAQESAEKIDPSAATRLTGQQVARTPSAAVVDMLGEPGRAVARWVANASPEARNTLNRMIDPRFEGQAARVVGWLNNAFHFPSATAQREALEAAKKTVNSANYERAMREGADGLWSPKLEQLAGSPAVTAAMQRASTAWKDEMIAAGQGAMNPRITFTPDGRMQIARGPGGVPVYPDLQYWDLVRRELSDAMQAAGEHTADGRRLGVFARQMNAELDRLVPSYAQARAGHAHFAGAKDALEAGENFVLMKGQNEEARRALARMSPTERQLFQDGFVSKYVEMLKEPGDRRNILNKIAESPGARERLEMVLGRQKSNELEAMLRVEGIMDLTRSQTQGNSTTTRQLIEAGLVATQGGVGAYYQGLADPGNLATTLIGSALVKRGRTTDQRVAQRVAEMLVSRDPAVMQKGLKVIARNQGFMDALRGLDKQIARISGQQGSAVPGVQSLGVGRAEDRQQQQ